MQTGEIFTKVVFDREKQGAYALEVEARDGAPSARPNSDNQPNSGMLQIYSTISQTVQYSQIKKELTNLSLDYNFFRTIYMCL